MKNITPRGGLVKIIKRLPSSHYGNPRFLVNFAGYTCKTPVDSMIGYEIQNFDGKICVGTIGTHYKALHINSIYQVEAQSELHAMLSER
jgi:hypothetical protein|tara:strand:+ start:61 stop:327 length:267 start_codon:yes stop_codon:yes gene_type:complete